MNKKIKYILGAIVCGSLLLSSCQDELAQINTDSSIIQKPDVRYLFTGELVKFDPLDYLPWFYDFTDMLQWGQVTTLGNTELLNQPMAIANAPTAFMDVLSMSREIDYRINQMSPEIGGTYKYIQAVSKSMVVYMGIMATDMYGSRPFSEAGRSRYTNPPLFKPKYDTQEELFNSFLEELDNSIKVLTNPVVVNDKTIPQVLLAEQDFVYKGDINKWVKFCNSLKLKIAVRLLTIDKTKAFTVAKEATTQSVGLITDAADDFIYNQGSEWYHSKEDPNPGDGTKTLIDFLVQNKDPRVRFFFGKNDFNSKVIQGFFDAEAKAAKEGQKFEARIPPFILNHLTYTTDGDGHKHFKEWKAPGEPWVRYYGLPLTINASKDPKWEDYFDLTGKLHKIKIGKSQKSYSPTSSLQMELYRGDNTYTYPDAPGTAVVKDDIYRPLYASYLSAGEINLYLAEFKLLGADIAGGSAQEYFTKGIECSVKGWNKIAQLNHIPYYDKTYDPNETVIALKSNELDDLLKQPAYKLNGDGDDLEKVYIQERLNFIFMPQDMYVTMRRSGVPMKNSKYLPLENFNKDGSPYLLPRRCPFFAGSPTDQMYNIYMKALEDQGFHIGYEPDQLHSERVWYDKNAPDFGEGPQK